MSQSVIRWIFKADGILTDPTSVKLSNEAGTYGVKRTDTDEVVVAGGTSMVKKSTGIYEYVFTDPAPNLIYDYWVEFVYGGETSWTNHTQVGGTAAGTNLYNLVSQIAPYCGGIPDLVLKQQLRLVAHDFCRQTEIWREDLAPFVTVADEAEYQLTPGYDAVILRVRFVEIGDPTPDDPSTEGTYSDYKVSETGLLTLVPAPTEDNLNVEVQVVLLPKEDCAAYPSWFLNRWGYAVVAGAIANIKLMSGKPWYDPNGAVMPGQRYMRAIGDAKRETYTSRRHGQLRVQIPEFI